MDATQHGGDALNYYNAVYQAIDTYSGSNESSSSNEGTNWTAIDCDLYFKTYVEYDQAVSASGS